MNLLTILRQESIPRGNYAIYNDKIALINVGTENLQVWDFNMLSTGTGEDEQEARASRRSEKNISTIWDCQLM